MAAWKSRVTEKEQELTGNGVSKETIERAKEALRITTETPSYADLIPFPEGHRHYGKFQDDPPPEASTINQFLLNPIIPKEVATQGREEMKGLLASGVSTYFAYNEKTDDQMSSLPDTHRQGAFQMYTDDAGIGGLFYILFGGMDFNGDFPGVYGGNHIGPAAIGPLKTDWTIPCPVEWTPEQRDKECISQQEAVWGTRTLRRLQKIKADIDPLHIFNCFNCITPEERGSGNDDDDDDKGSVKGKGMMMKMMKGKGKGMMRNRDLNTMNGPRGGTRKSHRE